MDSEVLIALIGLVSGLTVATVGAVVKGALEQRATTDEDLRAVRLKTYPWMWRRTATVSWWPSGRSLSYDELKRLHLDLRAWYFGLDEVPGAPMTETPGGLYLSENGKDRYGELQTLIDLSLHVLVGERTVPDDDQTYKDLRDSCSAFRTALTEDLETRRKRSVVRAFTLWRFHREQKSDAEERNARTSARSSPQSVQPSNRG